jgi:hypothetical protein
MKMLRCGNQQWCQSNADVTSQQPEIHQPDEEWQHGNKRGCRQNQIRITWQSIICQSNYVNGGAANDKCASQAIRYGRRTNNFVCQVQKWRQ